MPRFSLGDKVCLKASPERIGTVSEVFDGPEPQYEVFFNASESTTYPEASLISAEEPGSGGGPLDLLKRWELGTAEELRSFLTLAKLATPVANNLYSFLASRTELLPYQFKPVLKLIESPYSRLLIADEVGLGKTIEAGIVLTELAARTDLRRVLIICPSALLGKWRRELRERFELDFAIVRGGEFREQMEDSARGGDEPLRMIASIESLRREENLSTLIDARPRLDAVIVDEAHHMRNRGTKANFLGEVLSELGHTMLFLTATPLNLGERDFFELLHLLVPEEFGDFAIFQNLIEPNEAINATLRLLRHSWPPDFAAARDVLGRVETGSQGERFKRNPRYRWILDALDRARREPQAIERAAVVEIQRALAELNTLAHVFTRTKKREVSEHFPVRRAHRVSVDATAEEMAFYDAVTEWVQREYEGSDVPLGFVLVAMQRQAASCIPAMRDKLSESLRLGEVSFDEEELIDVPIRPEAGMWHEDEAMDEGAVATATLDRRQSDHLAELARAWRATEGIDTKYDRFEEELVSAIRRGADKVMVFAFFIRTIEYLEGRLRDLEVDGRPVAVHKIYGRTPADERHMVINRFRTGDGPQVLISSEVGSEGLDFQFCSTMFNYDLPWNPMRVEQRIGRLDRYGQQSELIEIFNLVVNDTIEDRIFYRLFDRIGIFERSIGDLEAILGDDIQQLQRDIFRRELTAEEQERRANLVADAILRRQQEHEEFDEQSKRFLGVDEVFAERFNDIQKSERYITAAELRNFIEQFLRRRFPRVRLVPTDSEGVVFELRNSDDRDFISFLNDAYYRDEHRSQLHDRLVTRLSTGERCALTFDAQRAMLDRELEFFTLHHPIVRAAVLDSRERERGLLPTGYLAVDDPRLDGPGRMFFVFELRSRGLRDEVELAAAVVDREGRLDEVLSKDFLGMISAARQPTRKDLGDLVSDESADAAMASARAWAGGQVARRQQQLEEVVNDAVDAQLESLRLSHERQVVAVEERLASAEREGQDRIARMRRGQLTNLHRVYEQKVRDLEDKRGVEVGHRLVATGALVRG